MGRKSKHTTEEKIQIVLDYKNGIQGTNQICNNKNISRQTLYKWVYIYEKHGEMGFASKRRNSSYSKEFKEKIVEEYIDGKGSLMDLCKKYNLPAHSMIQNWLKSYNSHEELKDYNPKGDIYMTKSRKTTLEERIEIVQYCLDHEKEYKLAAEYFNVSYTQVYQWVKKYLELGEEGLTDKRGKHKVETQLSELERLQLENERLKRQLELKERENIILKKLKEVERRRYSPKANKNRNT